MGVWFRRGIIVICLLLLLPNFISLFTMSTSLPEEVEEQLKNGNAKAYELNETIPFGQDTITIQKVVFLPDETLLQFKVKKKEPGWSFPNNALQLLDENGNEIWSRGGGGSSTPSSSTHINNYEKLPMDTTKITIAIDWYDRSYEKVIPLLKEGE